MHCAQGWWLSTGLLGALGGRRSRASRARLVMAIELMLRRSLFAAVSTRTRRCAPALGDSSSRAGFSRRTDRYRDAHGEVARREFGAGRVFVGGRDRAARRPTAAAGWPRDFSGAFGREARASCVVLVVG